MSRPIPARFPGWPINAPGVDHTTTPAPAVNEGRAERASELAHEERR